MKPRLLDLFCGAGGAGRGYQLAGFHVTSVDIEAQPRSVADETVQDGALAYLERLLWRRTKGDAVPFVAIHASPPCQAYSTVSGRALKGNRRRYPALIAATRELLLQTDLPYVLENVEGARKHLRSPARICGSSLGVDLRRHRYFETNWPLFVPPCAHGWQTPRFRSLDSRSKTGLASVLGVHGHHNYAGERELREQAMGIDWMEPDELVEAIPPVMTELIGHQLMSHVRARTAA